MKQKIDKARFFRRRQFAFGPEYINFDGWNKYHVADGFCLTAHPDLAVQEMKSATTSITLLGYIINPFHPEKSEAEILSLMLQEIVGLNDIATYLEVMSGRFVIIVFIEGKKWIFHDATGLRQILYCRDERGRVWCASQAETLAEQLGFSIDQEVLEYCRAPIFKEGKSEFWLSNDRTPYREILHLLPNHCLDLNNGKAIRFWPTKNCISKSSMEDGVRLSVPILKNTIESMCTKFDMKMGMSAGIDSRKTFAASKVVKNKIFYFTHEHDRCNIHSSDIKVPGKLLPKYGIRHHILNWRVMSEDFRGYYEASATCARETKGNIAYTLFSHFGIDFIVMNSNLSEISQCNYWLPKSKINGEGLAIITGLYHPLAISEFDKWLQGARGACEESGVNILELFHWEQRGGRWAAAAFGEYDIAHESFTPYNNRYFHKVLWGVSERYRRNRMWKISHEQIKKMWPEVLSEPINPGETFSEQLKEFVRRQVLHKYVTPWIPIYEYCRFWMKRRRLRRRYELRRSGL